MCMEDVRLGRVTRCGERRINLTVVSQRVIDQSKHRRTLILFPPPSGTTTFSIRDPVAANVGIVIPASSPPVTLTLDEHGDIVTKAFFAIHSVGGVVSVYIEGTLELE